MPLTCTLLTFVYDALSSLRLCRHPAPVLAAANRFLRTPLAWYHARNAQPGRATNATRLPFGWLGRWCDGRPALALGHPAPFLRWQRQGLRLCWRWTSRPGRPQMPEDLQARMRRRACAHPTWGQERLAKARLRKLGLRVSPRTG